ncbi:hypothetical protein [Desulfobaculum bizertense]|uniref:Uncharacterized protein n=1 Tax=Desulfobaculum bizertense DSM 18034 TaxID=1121442 RepID=A0A1T4W866_9BACT|nr:hypothetical protein [Desulfobaculum bizertense]UIJ39186.1 hypothetical protein LWC08_06330 [Desulfobaculum bizertense]SKA73514.1 hypothetical protein SAMN02745702_01872 [Desulfobaculum bizertense DSM 18034]
MKIAVEITVFDQVITKVVDYPGRPTTHAEVIQWLMGQTDFKWADYEHAPLEDKMMFHYTDGPTQ